MRTATLDLNSRGSFVDDLNSKPGIVMRRDALLHRSHEIQPAFFDSEKKEIHFSFFLLFFFFYFAWDLYVAPVESGLRPYGIVSLDFVKILKNFKNILKSGAQLPWPRRLVCAQN